MESFTVVDGIVLAVIALSAMLAFARGLMREVLSIAGWVGAAVVAFIFAPAVEPLIREIPVVRDVVGTSCELAILAGFVIVFAGALIVISLFTPLFAGIVQNSALAPFDKGLGFVFGVARGILLVLIAFLVYERVLGGAGGHAAIDNSHSRALFASLEADLARQIPEEAPLWVADQYETLTRNCQ